MKISKTNPFYKYYEFHEKWKISAKYLFYTPGDVNEHYYTKVLPKLNICRFFQGIIALTLRLLIFAAATIVSLYLAVSSTVQLYDASALHYLLAVPAIGVLAVLAMLAIGGIFFLIHKGSKSVNEVGFLGKTWLEDKNTICHKIEVE